ncbi:MAG: long-chain fatty acid--CoA ligase, partial [Pseudomonadales bacterium]
MSAPAQTNFLLFQAPDHFAKTTPQQSAFCCRDERISYAKLASRSNKLAHALISLGVKQGDRVGIFSQQSLHLPVAVFGIQKAGAAYVPIDPLTPAARLRQIIVDTGIEVLITQHERLGELKKVLAEELPLTALIGIKEHSACALKNLTWSEVEKFDDSLPAVTITEHDLAYIMMTSGSTGTPKGIMHTHFSGLSYAKLSTSTYAVTANDKIGSFAPLHFDISTFAYFAGPLAGATTVLIPEEQLLFPANVLDLAQKEAMTIWYSAPYILVQIARRDLLAKLDLSHLRWVKFGGEVLHPKYLRQLIAQLPGTQFSNVYGPAEVNQCTYQHFSSAPESDGPLPIGQVWNDTHALVLDENDQTVGPGEEGELLISSPTRMCGYWNKPG